MTLENMVQEVVAQYNRERDLDTDVTVGLVAGEAVRFVKQLETKINKGNRLDFDLEYKLLHKVFSELNNARCITYGNLNKTASMLKRIQKLKELSYFELTIDLDDYIWKPEELLEVLYLSNKIFTQVRTNREYVKPLEDYLNHMIACKGYFDELEDTYAYKQDIINVYQNEIRESTLDIKFAYGDKQSLSKRMDRYLKTYGDNHSPLSKSKSKDKDKQVVNLSKPVVNLSKH